jgi:hypothetical protein
MTSRFLDHPLFFSGTLFVLLVVAVESGFRIALLSAANLDQDRREQIAASRDALGILPSLLLGFTLAMALPRFDLRKHLFWTKPTPLALPVFAPNFCRWRSEFKLAHCSCNMS